MGSVSTHCNHALAYITVLPDAIHGTIPEAVDVAVDKTLHHVLAIRRAGLPIKGAIGECSQRTKRTLTLSIKGGIFLEYMY